MVRKGLGSLKAQLDLSFVEGAQVRATRAGEFHGVLCGVTCDLRPWSPPPPPPVAAATVHLWGFRQEDPGGFGGQAEAAGGGV